MDLPELTALVFRAGGATCALAAAQVVETMRPLPVAPLDRMPPYMRGVATIRGAATPVLDVGALLGQPGGDCQRFVTVRAAEGIVALAVEEVIGLARFAANDLRARPSLLSEAAGGVVDALAVKDAGLHLVLDSARILHLATLDA